MSIYDKLLQAIKKIPPNVKGTPIDRNQHITEMAIEPIFIPHIEGDYKLIALELWRIIEDIEKSELATGDNLALRSLVRELTPKRYVYMSEEKVKELIEYQVNQIKKEIQNDGI